MLRHGFTLAGEGGLGDAQSTPGEQPSIRADGVALGQGEDVSAHQLGRRHGHQFAAPQYGVGGGSHGAEGRNGVVSARLLHVSEDPIEKHDGGDHDRVDRRPVGVFDQPGSQGDGHRSQEQVDQRIVELGDEFAPGRHRRDTAQLVGSVCFEPSLCFGRSEAGSGIDAELVRDLPRFPQRGIRAGFQRGRHVSILTQDACTWRIDSNRTPGWLHLDPRGWAKGWALVRDRPALARASARTASTASAPLLPEGRRTRCRPATASTRHRRPRPRPAPGHSVSRRSFRPLDPPPDVKRATSGRRGGHWEPCKRPRLRHWLGTN